MTSVYTSTVVARGHLVAGALLGAAALCATAAGWLWPWPLGAALAFLLVGTGCWIGTVRLAVGSGELRVALGPWGRPRRIPFDAVRSAESVVLTRRQVFGLGLPWNARTTRLTVRRGPTLVVHCHDGEVLRVSTSDPLTAVRLVAR